MRFVNEDNFILKKREGEIKNNIFMEWIFEGIGTEVLVGLVSLLVGGGAGYYIGVKTTIKQKQKAKDNAQQVQIGQVNNYGDK